MPENIEDLICFQNAAFCSNIRTEYTTKVQVPKMVEYTIMKREGIAVFDIADIVNENNRAFATNICKHKLRKSGKMDSLAYYKRNERPFFSCMSQSQTGRAERIHLPLAI
ncbi:hypothetical protein AVEN_61567-1 [Araneus ventricosus]|uniref:Uncharacterized protein n=1 Tax=Araneus ventricosus TaxID=182803 RepID=A0A4Y2N2Y7_ARAVE|nr:hypothetical protein AVEN_61567-1 [Araneus ventricosus]